MNERQQKVWDTLVTFCDHPLAAPWVVGGHAYATNGWIACRHPCDGPDTPIPEYPRPDVPRLFANYPAPADGWLSLPPQKLIRAPCEWCRKTGKSQTECPICGGSNCQRCKGTRVAEQESPVPLTDDGSFYLAGRAVERLRSIEAEYAPPTQGTMGGPIRFRAGAYEGLVMAALEPAR